MIILTVEIDTIIWPIDVEVDVRGERCPVDHGALKKTRRKRPRSGDPVIQFVSYQGMSSVQSVKEPCIKSGDFLQTEHLERCNSMIAVIV